MDDKTKYKILYQKMTKVKNDFKEIDNCQNIMFNSLSEKIKINHSAICGNDIKNHKNRINSSKNIVTNVILPDIIKKMNN